MVYVIQVCRQLASRIRTELVFCYKKFGIYLLNVTHAVWSASNKNRRHVSIILKAAVAFLDAFDKICLSHITE